MKQSSAPACLATCTHVNRTELPLTSPPISFSILVHLHSLPPYRLPVALLPPTWNVNCARRVTDFSLCRDAHAYQDASEGTGGPFFFHFTIKPLGPPVCSSKPGRQSERAWKEQVGIPGAGAGVVMSPNTKGTGPGQWTDLVVERNTGYFSDIHRRAWRLWHLQQDLIWGVVYAGMYE